MRTMQKISIPAMLAGGIVDVVVTNALMIPVVIAAAHRIDLAGVASGDVAPLVMDVMRNDPSLFLASFLGWAAASVLGGYLAARIAGRSYLLNGALSAYLSVATSLYALASWQGGTMPLWQHMAFLPLSPALGALGGYIVERRGVEVGFATPERAA